MLSGQADRFGCVLHAAPGANGAQNERQPVEKACCVRDVIPDSLVISGMVFLQEMRKGKRNVAKGIRRLFGDTGDKNPAEEEWRGGVYLTTVTSSFEADILESKLMSLRIFP